MEQVNDYERKVDNQVRDPFDIQFCRPSSDRRRLRQHVFRRLARLQRYCERMGLELATGDSADSGQWNFQSQLERSIRLSGTPSHANECQMERTRAD